MKNGHPLNRRRSAIWATCLLIGLWTGSSLVAQRLDEDIESLAVLPLDSNRVLALCRISEGLRRDYPDSAMTYATQAMSLSRKLNFLHGQAEARLLQARAFVAKGAYEDADASLKVCESEFGQTQELRGIAACAIVSAEIHIARKTWNQALAECHRADSIAALDSLPWWASEYTRGKLFQELGSLDQAGQYFTSAMRLASSAGDVRGRAMAGEALATVLLSQGKNDSAIVQNHSAYEAWKAAGDRSGQSTALVGEGTANVRAGKPEAGFKLLRRGYQLALEDRSPTRAGLALIRIAEAEVKLGLPDSAQLRCYDALGLLRRRSDPGPALDARIGIVQAALIRGDFARALRHGDTAIAIADSFALYKPLYNVNQLLSKAYQTQGDYRRALDHFMQATVAKDSLQRQKERSLTLAMQVRLADESEFAGAKTVQKAISEAQSATQKLHSTRLLLWIVLGLLAVGLGLGIMLGLRGRREARRMRLALAEKSDALEKSEQELSRVTHRLQNTNIDYDAVVAERTETLQEAVQSLIAENEALEDFINRSSNDLLGPIARIKGLVQISRSSGQIKDLVQAIDMIEAVTSYTDKVLRKLILVHELKNAFLDIKPVNLEEMIMDTLPKLKELPGVKYPDIRLEDRLKRPVMVDGNLMRIIVENLLENACIFRRDANSDSPKIHVLLQKEDEDILISVHDEGIGIPNEIRDKIFNLFFRGSQRSKGQGLGLYLVQRALREIGGRIAVESKAGAFTEFTVRFREMEG